LAAEVHRRAGRLDAAVRHLEAAVELDPGDRDSRTLLALLRAESPGEGSGVTRLLRDDTFATVAFGALCLEQGLADEAAVVFTRVLRRDPDDPEARARLELALRARSRRRG
jgi:tetratricopeptide (TPR) repeat protein